MIYVLAAIPHPPSPLAQLSSPVFPPLLYSSYCDYYFFSLLVLTCICFSSTSLFLYVTILSPLPHLLYLFHHLLCSLTPCTITIISSVIFIAHFLHPIVFPLLFILFLCSLFYNHLFHQLYATLLSSSYIISPPSVPPPPLLYTFFCSSCSLCLHVQPPTRSPKC